MSNANLKGVKTDNNFSGANLSNVIWIDGSKCPNGWIGRCK